MNFLLKRLKKFNERFKEHCISKPLLKEMETFVVIPNPDLDNNWLERFKNNWKELKKILLAEKKLIFVMIKILISYLNKILNQQIQKLLLIVLLENYKKLKMLMKKQHIKNILLLLMNVLKKSN